MISDDLVQQTQFSLPSACASKYFIDKRGMPLKSDHTESADNCICFGDVSNEDEHQC